MSLCKSLSSRILVPKWSPAFCRVVLLIDWKKRGRKYPSSIIERSMYAQSRVQPFINLLYITWCGFWSCCLSVSFLRELYEDKCSSITVERSLLCKITHYKRSAYGSSWSNCLVLTYVEECTLIYLGQVSLLSFTVRFFFQTFQLHVGRKLPIFDFLKKN